MRVMNNKSDNKTYCFHLEEHNGLEAVKCNYCNVDLCPECFEPAMRCVLGEIPYYACPNCYTFRYEYIDSVFSNIWFNDGYEVHSFSNDVAGDETFIYKPATCLTDG